MTTPRFASAATAPGRPGVLWLIALAVLTVTLGAGSGFIAPPGDWYASLTKPSWNPPSWVFGPVWTTLYVMMATAFWLVWRDRTAAVGHRRHAMLAYGVQFALNLLWSPAFFALHNPGLALVVIVALWLCIAWTIRAMWRVRPIAGALLLPYLAWVSFATVLNATLWWLNR